MRVILFVLSLIAFLVGMTCFAGAHTVIQELEGGIFLIISAVLLAGAGIVDAIKHLQKEIYP
jgi:UDP-N-acetylglucosamine enolpyruvyl transferase